MSQMVVSAMSRGLSVSALCMAGERKPADKQNEHVTLPSKVCAVVSRSPGLAHLRICLGSNRFGAIKKLV